MQSFCISTLEPQGFRTPTLSGLTVQNPRLKLLLQCEFAEMKASFQELKAQLGGKQRSQFKYETMAAFWFALHLQNLHAAQIVYAIDPVIEQIMKNLRENGEVDLRLKRKKEADKKKQINFVLPEDNRDSQGGSEGNGSRDSQKGDGGGQHKKSNLLPDIHNQECKGQFEDELTYNITSAEDLEEIRYLLTQKGVEVGIPFNTNVLKILLNMKEGALAAAVPGLYNIEIDEKIMVRAIEARQTDFLYSVYAFNKNYTFLGNQENFNEDSNVESVSLDEDSKYKTFTFEWLFQSVLDQNPDHASQLIQTIAHWKLVSNESILRSLLVNRQDEIAAEAGTFYKDQADNQLFFFAIANNNETFLKHALSNEIFPRTMLQENDVIDHLLDVLEEASKTEFILNILIFSDLGEWRDRKDVERIIEFFEGITDASKEPNLMYRCYNPILVLCLGCEILKRIGSIISSYRDQTYGMCEDLPSMGEKIIENLDPSDVETIFMESDFKDRTVLKLIALHQFGALLKDEKVSNLIDELWMGKLVYQCDGRVTDYSMLGFLASAPIKKLPGQKMEIRSILSTNFKVDIQRNNFAFQYKFRQSSPAFLFQKELISTVCITALFVYANLLYLSGLAAGNFSPWAANIQTLNDTLNDADYWAALGQGGETTPTSCPVTTSADGTTSGGDSSLEASNSSSGQADGSTTEANDTAESESARGAAQSVTDSSSGADDGEAAKLGAQQSGSQRSLWSAPGQIPGSFETEQWSAEEASLELLSSLNASEASIFSSQRAVEKVQGSTETSRDDSSSKQESCRTLQAVESTDGTNDGHTDPGGTKTAAASQTSSSAEATSATGIEGDMTGNAAADALEGATADATADATATPPGPATSDEASTPTLLTVTTLFDGTSHELANYTLVCQLMASEQDGLNNALQEALAGYQAFNMYGVVAAVSLMFYVVTKFVFNKFTAIKLPLDTWSKVDIVCSLTNIVAFSLLSQLTPEALQDPGGGKVFFNVLMILSTLAAWSRLAATALLVPAFAILLLTTYTMLTHTASFLLVILLYMIVISSVAVCLFQESATAYSSFGYAARCMFDALIGPFAWDIAPEYLYLHTAFMVVHLFLSQVLLLNYMVAILGTVYEEEMEAGEFQFKCNKYEYIERCMIAFSDPNGYAQLIVHAPPINFPAVFLLPAVFDKARMKRWALWFSLAYFWFENIYFILEQLLYELFLIPLIYCRVAFYIAKLGGLHALHLLVGWLLGGLFYLAYGLCKDMYYFVAILSDYKLGVDEAELLEREDTKKDKIIIMNEVIDVMKAILLIFYQQEGEKLGKSGDGGSMAHKSAEAEKLQASLTLEEALRQLRAGGRAGEDDGEEPEVIEGYTMEKSLIIEAWARFRPTQPQGHDGSKKGGSRGSRGRKQAKNVKDFKGLYGDSFLNKLMAGIRLKVYEYAEADHQIKRKQAFKHGFVGVYKQIILEEERQKKLEEEKLEGQEEPKAEPDPLEDVPEEELALIEAFLAGFVLQTDSGSKMDQVDLKLVLEALPDRIDEFNERRCELYSFEATSASLIAFFNQNQDDLFKYYDARNKTRLNKLAGKAEVTKAMSYQMIEMAQACLSIVKKISAYGELFYQHANRMKECKDEIQKAMKKYDIQEYIPNKH